MHSVNWLKGAIIALMASGSVAVTTNSAQAQAYPSKPTAVVVPFAPGGRVDGIARLLAQSLSEQLGQPFVVENREGAGGATGSDYVANADADGYTLLLISAGTHTIQPNVNADLPYDALADFTPIANLVEGFTFIGAHPSLNVNTIEELVAAAKEKPGTIGFATSGIGTYGHFAGELFQLASGAELLHTPYRGSGPAMTDLAAGHVPLMIAGEIVELGKAGTIKILATTNETRWHELPDTPTMAESGFPQFTVHSWIGLSGPAGIPEETVAAISAATEKAMADPEVQEKMQNLGVVVNFMPHDAFAQRIAADHAAYASIVTEAGLVFE